MPAAEGPLITCFLECAFFTLVPLANLPAQDMIQYKCLCDETEENLGEEELENVFEAEISDSTSSKSDDEDDQDDDGGGKAEKASGSKSSKKDKQKKKKKQRHRKSLRQKQRPRRSRRVERTRGRRLALLYLYDTYYYSPS